MFNSVAHGCVFNRFLDNNEALWRRGIRHISLWINKQTVLVNRTEGQSFVFFFEIVEMLHGRLKGSLYNDGGEVNDLIQ